MAKGIGIIFNADANEVVDESKRVQKALEGVDEGLDDVGKSAQKSETKQSDALDSVAKNAEDLGDTVGKDTAGAFGELADKADGSLGGIADGLLGVAGIAGGVGGAVTTLMGGAVDYVTGLIEEQQAAAAQLKSDLVDAYKSASDESRNYLDAAQIAAAAQNIFFDESKMEDYRNKAALIGVDVNTYVLAQAGSYEDLRVVIEAARVAEQTRGEDYAKAGQAQTTRDLIAIDNIISSNESLVEVHKQAQDAALQDAATRELLSQRAIDGVQHQRDVLKALRDDTAGGIPVALVIDGSAIDRELSRHREINVTVNGYTRDGQRVV